MVFWEYPCSSESPVCRPIVGRRKPASLIMVRPLARIRIGTVDPKTAIFKVTTDQVTQ